VPRKINTLCSRVLLFGYLEDRHALNEVDVDEVARDLALESLRVLPPKHGENNSSTLSVPEAADHGRLSERIAALETQLAAQDRTIRKLLKMAAAFLDSETP
jgi:general secretion pathway protein A